MYPQSGIFATVVRVDRRMSGASYQYDRTAVPCIGVAVCLYLVDRERFVTRGSELTVAATSLLLSYAAAWLAVALRLQHS